MTGSSLWSSGESVQNGTFAADNYVTNIIATSGVGTAFVDTQLDEQSADLLNSFDTVWSSDGMTERCRSNRRRFERDQSRFEYADLSGAILDGANLDAMVVKFTNFIGASLRDVSSSCGFVNHLVFEHRRYRRDLS